MSRGAPGSVAAVYPSDAWLGACTHCACADVSGGRTAASAEVPQLEDLRFSNATTFAMSLVTGFVCNLMVRQPSPVIAFAAIQSYRTMAMRCQLRAANLGRRISVMGLLQPPQMRAAGQRTLDCVRNCPTAQSTSRWGPPAASVFAAQQGHQTVSAPFHVGRATSRIESVTLSVAL